MTENSFFRYFTFWFAHLANSERNRVWLHEKDYYILTNEAAKKHGPIAEDGNLGKRVEEIFQTLKPVYLAWIFFPEGFGKVLFAERHCDL